ncbi:MAG: hypothetical protein SVS85_04615 [Candidatus Nanohaloarchaea archaeon]|nr:hypothetical protein [Candidatus Nanohaloarchaea archaeon]
MNRVGNHRVLDVELQGGRSVDLNHRGEKVLVVKALVQAAAVEVLRWM